MREINFPVVGIGASAGGLKVLQDFFDHIPENSGLAFVVIVHLAPKKTSAMESLLASHTKMEVKQIGGSTKIQPNHIYIIPPNNQLRVENSQLKLAAVDDEPQAVIDIFLRSMAKACEKQSIGIILSGTGSDGTLGLQAVKEYGGVTMVQDPREAEYDGMPRSAIETDLVDFVLPVEELARKVLDYKDFLGSMKMPTQAKQLSEPETGALKKLFSLLLSEKGYDFNNYKRSSVLRRLQRRMQVTRQATIGNYLAFLKKNPTEINELFKDLLISVTNFFRDPQEFEELEKRVIPKLFEGKDRNDQIRIWIIGCATGEEVYSLAILLHEYASKLDYLPQIKIFGTDISDDALKVARKGIYPESISADVSKRRLSRYFHKEDTGYRVRREIRDMVLISKHNIISDPPFTNIDLVSCRNLLIYFNSDLQAKVLRVLQYALKIGGFLFLGKSESTVGAIELFEQVEDTKNIYRTKALKQKRAELPRFLLWQNMKQKREGMPDFNSIEVPFEQVHRSLLAEQYGPGSVIINEQNQVMHFSEGVNRYLQYEEGEPTNDLLKLVIPELQRPLRAIIFRFNQVDPPQSISREVQVRYNDGIHVVNLRMQPIKIEGFPKGYRQVIFEEIKEVAEGQEIIQDQPLEESEIVKQLETELEQTKEQLQQTIEEYETSNEELMASNEELQSMNEELQTTTEELETSQEELQSVNEELRTVNQELESKIEEVQQVNDDLKKLMEATQIAIIFVDRNLKIRRFTNSASDLFNFINSDIGRPLSDVTHDLEYKGLIEDVDKMIGELHPVEKQIHTNDGKWFNMQIKPYRTTDNQIDGAVITFMDISDLKKVEKELEEKIELQKQLQQDLLRVEKKDRWSIGQFLHDEVAQNLLSVKTLLDAKSKQIRKLDKETQIEIGKVKNMIVESLQNIRDLSHFVLPLSEGVENVAHALELLVKQTENVYDVKCNLTSDDNAKKITNNSLIASIYYIVQEAISNSVKHGKADQILINVEVVDEFLYLVVEDDGIGFEKINDGRGIKIMKYRTELLEGKFEVNGHRKTKGTVVKCTIPLKRINK